MSQIRQNRFQLSAGLNIETLNTIGSGNTQPYLSRVSHSIRGSNSLNSASESTANLNI